MFFSDCSYRLVDQNQSDDHRCLASFDCAYDAADALRRGLHDDRDAAQSWRILGFDGRVLFGPDDLELEAS